MKAARKTGLVRFDELADRERSIVEADGIMAPGQNMSNSIDCSKILPKDQCTLPNRILLM